MWVNARVCNGHREENRERGGRNSNDEKLVPRDDDDDDDDDHLPSTNGTSGSGGPRPIPCKYEMGAGYTGPIDATNVS